MNGNEARCSPVQPVSKSHDNPDSLHNHDGDLLHTPGHAIQQVLYIHCGSNVVTSLRWKRCLQCGNGYKD